MNEHLEGLAGHIFATDQRSGRCIVEGCDRPTVGENALCARCQKRYSGRKGKAVISQQGVPWMG